MVGSGAGGRRAAPTRPALGVAASLTSGRPARSPTPLTGGPLYASRAPDRPRGDENVPWSSDLCPGDRNKPFRLPPFLDLETQPEGPLVRTPRLPGDPDNTQLTFPGIAVWGA